MKACVDRNRGVMGGTLGVVSAGLIALAAGTALVLTPAAHAQGGAERATPPGITKEIEFARDKVFPALVNIQVVSVSYWGGSESKNASIGSGTIISADGLIVTNQHVVDDGRTFRVTLSDKREVGATLVGEDPMTDLAVLRIKMDELKGGPLPAIATWGDSDALEVGDYVMAMGAPYGLTRSVSLGIVSNTERVFASMSGDDIADQEFDFEYSSDIFTRWIQHDALILPGNSGGPLVNLKGEIVGVNTRGGSGYGFANPTSLARTIAQALIEGGSVTRSTIGVAMKSVKRAGLDEGVLVNSVDADGPAAKAGLQAGDVLLTIDGKPIAARFPEEIPIVLRAIAEKPVGSSIATTYKRGDTTGSATIVTEKLKRERGEETALRVFGMSISEITDRMARARRLANKEGVYVLGVRSGGPSQTAEPAIGGGDVIRAINGAPVKTIKDMVEAYKAIAAQDPLPEYVTIEYDRAGKNTLTLIKPRPDKKEDPPRELPKAWIGVATQPVLKELAKQIGLEDQTGFRVTRIYPGTLAAQSDLKVGDIITQVNGEKINPRGMQDAGMFQRRVRQLGTSGDATLAVLRGKAATEVKVGLERTRLTQDEALRDENRDFELTVRELTFFDRDDNRWDENVQGVIVVGVERVGWAGFAGIFEGDLIQKIGTHTITDLASYRAAMADIAKQQPTRVPFVVLRGLRTQFKFAEPEWKPVVPDQKAEGAADKK